MTTKSMSYDHAAYTAVQSQGMGAITGSGGVSSKFAAFTARLLKSIQLRTAAQGSSADVLNLITVSGTTTTTTAITTAGSASPATNSVLNVALASGGLTLNQGDGYYLVKGTDATLTWWAEAELVTTPGANVTQ